jgi:hypothetical protein
MLLLGATIEMKMGCEKFLVLLLFGADGELHNWY